MDLVSKTITTAEIDAFVDSVVLDHMNGRNGEGFRAHCRTALERLALMVGFQIVLSPDPLPVDELTGAAAEALDPVDAADAGLKRLFARKLHLTSVDYRCTRPTCRDPLTKAPTKMRVKFFETEPVPAYLTCFRCRAGLNLNDVQMAERGEGMAAVTSTLRVTEEDGKGGEIEVAGVVDAEVPAPLKPGQQGSVARPVSGIQQAPRPPLHRRR